MITIVHGDNTQASRSFFQEQKEKSKSPVLLDGESLTLTQLMQIIDGGGLFVSDQTIFVDNFLSKRKVSKDVDDITGYLKAHEAASIFFWEPKTLTKKQLGVFPKALVKSFFFPQTIFKFVDAVIPGQGAKLIPMFHNTLQNTDPHIVFSMLVRQARLMLALTDPMGDQIDEIKYMQPWQQSNISRQSRNFTTDQLTKLYRSLSQIDLAQKTSAQPFSMVQAIDFLLLEL